MPATTAATGTVTSVKDIATATANTTRQYYWNTVAKNTLSTTINAAAAAAAATAVLYWMAILWK